MISLGRILLGIIASHRIGVLQEEAPGTRSIYGDAPRGHIFVSHAKEDGDFAELLKLKLERERHEAWVDSDRLDPGLDWRSEIDEAVREALAVLAIMSPEARASE